MLKISKLEFRASVSPVEQNRSRGWGSRCQEILFLGRRFEASRRSTTMISKKCFERGSVGA